MVLSTFACNGVHRKGPAGGAAVALVIAIVMALCNYVMPSVKAAINACVFVSAIGIFSAACSCGSWKSSGSSPKVIQALLRETSQYLLKYQSSAEEAC